MDHRDLTASHYMQISMLKIKHFSFKKENNWFFQLFRDGARPMCRHTRAYLFHGTMQFKNMLYAKNSPKT